MTILLQRLCWNTNSWRGPTGDMYGKEKSYVGKNGFGHEEWNLNVSDVLDGKAFGYTYYNPPDHSSLIGKAHDIFFFAINPAKERALVGYYEGAVFLDQEEREKLKDAFEQSDILDKRIEEFLALGLPSIKTTNEARRLLLDQFSANIVVNPGNVHSFGTPVVMSAEMLEGREPKYLSRYTTPVFLTSKPFIRKHKSGAGSKPSTGSDVRSNSNLASGLKSRPRNCPYALVARRSGVQVIESREFLNDKDAGRNASEPRSSLVNEMRLPTSCLYREGRSVSVLVMEATLVSRRGSRVGMYRKLNCPVLEIHNGGGRLPTAAYKETKWQWIVMEVGGVHSTD